MKNLNPHFETVMDEYRSGRFTNITLARSHSVSPSTISHWARNANLKQKPRGRRCLDKPSITHQEIIQLSAHLTLAKIAERFGVSRQRVHQILKRWNHLRPPPPPMAKVNSNPAPGRRVRALKDRRRRELVICFRLRADELALLRESLPQSVTQSTRSPHKLVRAAVLEKLENARMLHASTPSHLCASPASGVVEGTPS